MSDQDVWQENFDWAPFDPEAEARLAEETRQQDLAAREQAARFQLLPSWANPDTDMPLGRDEETGYPRYQGVGGRIYLWPELQNVEAVERRPATEVVRQAYDAIPPIEDWRLPTMSELGSAASAVGEAVWDVVESPTNPNATLSNAWDVAGMAMTGGVAGTAPAGAIRSGLSRSSQDRIPMFRERETPLERPSFEPQQIPDRLDEPIDWEATGMNPPEGLRGLTYREWSQFTESDEGPYEFLARRGLLGDEEAENFIIPMMDNERLGEETMARWLGEGTVLGEGISRSARVAGPVATFRSPISEALDTVPIPRNGIRGADFYRYLQNHPDVRSSELKSIGLELDAQRRYTQEELREVVSPHLWEVTTERAGQGYSAYQRQELGDQQVDYQELIVRAERGGDLPTYRPSNGVTHFTPDTMAHARVSIRQGEGPTSPDNRPYLLIEELQSDLVQHGYRKPASEPSTAIPPITNNREFTRALVESVLAYAQQEGVEEIVFPPFERIVSRRFNVGTPQYEQALQPGSGFHRTYVTALNDVITELQDEFGHNMISVGPRELPYETQRGVRPFNQILQEEVNRFDIIDEDVRDGIVEQVLSSLSGSDVENLQLPHTIRQAREGTFEDASELRGYLRRNNIEDPSIGDFKDPISHFRDLTRASFGARSLMEVGKYVERVVADPTQLLPDSTEQRFIQFLQDVYLINPWDYRPDDNGAPVAFRTWMQRELDKAPTQVEERIFEALRYMAFKAQQQQTLPTEGISINIGNLYDYDLTRPRFFKGGLVTQTKQLFGDLV